MGLFPSKEEREIAKGSVMLYYEGGHPELSFGATSYPVRINKKDDTLIIIYSDSFFGKIKTFEIPKDKIIGVNLLRDGKIERSTGKVLAGAVVGGILTGGVGALIGAGWGAKGKKKDDSKIILSVQLRDNLTVEVIFGHPDGAAKYYNNFIKLIA